MDLRPKPSIASNPASPSAKFVDDLTNSGHAGFFKSCGWAGTKLQFGHQSIRRSAVHLRELFADRQKIGEPAASYRSGRPDLQCRSVSAVGR